MADKKFEPQASVGIKDANVETAPHGEVSRKSFIGWMTLGWTAFGLATGGFSNHGSKIFISKCII